MPFIEPDEMAEGRPLPGWHGRFFHSEHMTFALWEIEGHASPLHAHQHPEEEVWNVVEGKLALSISGVERIVRPGIGVVVPPNTFHSARPIGVCRAIVTNYPTRPDLPGVSRPTDDVVDDVVER